MIADLVRRLLAVFVWMLVFCVGWAALSLVIGPLALVGLGVSGLFVYRAYRY